MYLAEFRLLIALWRDRRDRGTDQKDVKNEGRSDYVHENKGDDDIMSSEKRGFLHENARIAR
jgi:hypothetical protein